MTDTTKKITEHAIYTAIANGTLEDLDPDIVAEWANKKIAQLERKAAKAKETAAAKKAEGDALTKAVLEAVTDEFEPIADIMARIEGDDVTMAKVAYRLNAAFKDGKLEKGEVVLTGENGKRKVVAYRNIG